MKNIYNNICIILSISSFLIFFGEFIFVAFGKGFNLLAPTENFMSATIGVVAVILSIAFPIIVGNVSQCLKPYKSEYIANIFKKEYTYKSMLFVIILLIISLWIFIFFKNPEIGEKYRIIDQILGCTILILGIVSIVIFYLFTKKFTEYVVNTDKVLRERLNKKELKLNYGESDFTPHVQLIQEYGRICIQKVKIEDYNNLDSVLQSMNNILRKSYKGIKIQNIERENILAPLVQNICDIYYNTWHRTYHVSPNTATMIIQQYESILGEIIKMNLPNDNIINGGNNGIFFILFQRIANEIDNNVSKKDYIYMQYVWEWYFDLLTDDKFEIKFINRMNIYLFLTMKIIVNNDNRYVFNSFIEATIDRWLCPNDLYLPLDFHNELLDKIDKIRFKIPLAFTTKNYQEYYELYKEIEIEIKKSNKQDHIDVKKIENFILTYFKYNNLRLVVCILGAYCLFKNRMNYIHDILYYNQPKEAITKFGNKDIVPDNVMILIELYFNKYFILRDYMTLWGKHNDPYYWFDKYLAILFCKLISENRNLSYDIKYWGENKQALEQTALALRNLSELISNIGIDILNAIEIDSPQEVKEKAIKYIDEMIHTTGIEKEKIEIAQDLDKEKIDRFKDIVHKKINDNSGWMRILDKKSPANDDFQKFVIPINYKKIITKSFLAQGDEGYYIGFEHNIAEIIIDQIDYIVEQKLVGYFHEKLEKEINKINLDDKIFQLGAEDIVVLINRLDIYNLLIKDTSFKWENTGYLLGYTSNDTAIYLFTDRHNTSSRIFIFNKQDISKLGIKNEKIEITDLNKDETIIQEIIDAQPYWLKQESLDEEEQKTFLRKNLEVNYSSQLIIMIKENINIDYLKEDRLSK